MAKTNLTAQRLREVLDYNPETGKFTNKRTLGRSAAGSIAGRLHATNGYIYIGIDRSRFFAHRLAWLHVYGEWPDGEIDHINRNKSDNRIENLRPVSHALNNQNKVLPQSNSKLQLRGVSPHRKGFQAVITVNQKQKYLGVFATAQDASAAYWKAKAEIHPAFNG